MTYNNIRKHEVARYDRLNVLAIFTSKGIYPQPLS